MNFKKGVLEKKDYYSYFVKSKYTTKINDIFTELENEKTYKKYNEDTIKKLKFKITNLKNEIGYISFLEINKDINNMSKEDRTKMYNILKENLKKENLFSNNRPTKLYYQIEKLIDFIKYLFKKNIVLKDIFTFGSSASFIKNVFINESEKSTFISKNTRKIINEYNGSHNLLQLIILAYNIIKNPVIEARLINYVSYTMKDAKKALGQAIKYLYEQAEVKYESSDLEKNLKTKDYFMFLPDNDKKIKNFLTKIDPKMPLAQKGKDLLIFNKKTETLYIGEIKLINESGGGQNHQFKDLLKTANSKYELNTETMSTNKLKEIYKNIYGEDIETNDKEEIIKKLGFRKIQGIGILHGASIYNFNKDKKSYMNELVNNKNIYLLSEIVFFHEDIFKKYKILYQENRVKIKNFNLLKELEKTKEKIDFNKNIIDIRKINFNKLKEKYFLYLTEIKNIKNITLKDITQKDILQITDEEILEEIFTSENDKAEFKKIQDKYLKGEISLSVKN